MTDTGIKYQFKDRTILILFGLVIFNIVSYNLFIKDSGGYDDAGSPIAHSPTKMLSSSVIFFFIALPLISAILALVIGIFPIKNMYFDQVFKRAWWVTLIGLNGLFSFMLLGIIVMTIIGWYPIPYK